MVNRKHTVKLFQCQRCGTHDTLTLKAFLDRDTCLHCLADMHPMDVGGIGASGCWLADRVDEAYAELRERGEDRHGNPTRPVPSEDEDLLRDTIAEVTPRLSAAVEKLRGLRHLAEDPRVFGGLGKATDELAQLAQIMAATQEEADERGD